MKKKPRRAPALAKKVRAKRPKAPKAANARARRVEPVSVSEIDAVRKHLEAELAKPPPRWNASQDDVQRSVVRLVLTLVEFLRQLMERQAIRRMEAETLNEAEIEAVGRALMQLEETIVELCRKFDIPPEELNLELGPLGRML